MQLLSDTAHASKSLIVVDENMDPRDRRNAMGIEDGEEGGAEEGEDGGGGSGDEDL